MLKPPSVSDSYASSAALLLAGGMGVRMGGARKADLMVGGRRLFDLACGNLCAQSPKVIAAMGAGEFMPAPAETKVTQIADRGNGPAAAILHAAGLLRELAPNTDFLLVAPCDAPFMPEDFAARALTEIGDNDVVAGKSGDRLYPTHSLWRVSSLARLVKAFAPSDCPSLFALLDRLDCAALPYDFAGELNPFFNINTTADLVAANREIQRRRKATFS